MEKPQPVKYQEKLNEINSIGLAKKLVWVFIQHLTKTQINFWPTQYLMGAFKDVKDYDR